MPPGVGPLQLVLKFRMPVMPGLPLRDTPAPAVFRAAGGRVSGPSERRIDLTGQESAALWERISTAAS